MWFFWGGKWLCSVHPHWIITSFFLNDSPHSLCLHYDSDKRHVLMSCFSFMYLLFLFSIMLEEYWLIQSLFIASHYDSKSTLMPNWSYINGLFDWSDIFVTAHALTPVYSPFFSPLWVSPPFSTGVGLSKCAVSSPGTWLILSSAHQRFSMCLLPDCQFSGIAPGQICSEVSSCFVFFALWDFLIDTHLVFWASGFVLRTHLSWSKPPRFASHATPAVSLLICQPASTPFPHLLLCKLMSPQGCDYGKPVAACAVWRSVQNLHSFWVTSNYLQIYSDQCALQCGCSLTYLLWRCDKL